MVVDMIDWIDQIGMSDSGIAASQVKKYHIVVLEFKYTSIFMDCRPKMYDFRKFMKVEPKTFFSLEKYNFTVVA